MPGRISSPYQRPPLTEDGAGELDIDASTTEPTQLSNKDFDLVDTTKKQVLAAARFLNMYSRLSGSGADDAAAVWWLMLWHPKGGESNDGHWYWSGPFTTAGPVKILTTGSSNIHTPRIGRNVIAGMIHCPSLPTNTVLHVIVDEDNE